MPVEALTCPNCSASLPVSPGQTLALCLYCHSSIRLTWNIPGPAQLPETPAAPSEPALTQAAVERTLPPEVAVELRQLVLEGRQPEAEQRYGAATGAGQPETRQAIASLADQILHQSLNVATLNARGISMVLGGLALILGCGAAGLIGSLFLTWQMFTGASSAITYLLILWVVCVIGIGYGLRLGWMFRTNIMPTIRFLPGKHAQATVLKSVVIGREGSEYNVRLWLEVHPDNGQPFRVDLTLLSTPDHLSHTHPGAVFQVKYLPNDHSTVVLEKVLVY